MEIQAKILAFIPPDTSPRLLCICHMWQKSQSFTVASSIQYKVQLMAKTELIILVVIAD